MNVSRFANMIAMPWKNGGGVTRELLRSDRNGETTFRLSIADVAAEGPFSAFPGMQRILTVVEGKGMRLVRPDGSFLVARLFSPVAFSGDESIAGQLPHGPCRDINVIWNPVHCEAGVSLVGKGDTAAVPEGGKLVVVSVVNGTLLQDGCRLDFGDWMPVVAENPVLLAEGKAVLVTIRERSHP